MKEEAPTFAAMSYPLFNTTPAETFVPFVLATSTSTPELSILAKEKAVPVTVGFSIRAHLYALAPVVIIEKVDIFISVPKYPAFNLIAISG